MQANTRNEVTGFIRIAPCTRQRRFSIRRVARIVGSPAHSRARLVTFHQRAFEIQAPLPRMFARTPTPSRATRSIAIPTAPRARISAAGARRENTLHVGFDDESTADAELSADTLMQRSSEEPQ
jgi:hypothetical protein